jgi:hypothetical protein
MNAQLSIAQPKVSHGLLMQRQASAARTRRGRFVALSAVFLACIASFALAAGPSAGAGGNQAAAHYGQIPLSFERNLGQADARVQFVSRGPGYSLLLAPGEVVLDLEKLQAPSSIAASDRKPVAPLADTLHMTLMGANANAASAPEERLPGVVSYFIGSDPKKWHTAIATFGRVNYTGIYPGVDLVFYGNQRQLEYDFVVAPGADPSRIAWNIDGAGAALDADGNLVLTAAHGPASFKKPVIYQSAGGKKTGVDGRFAVTGNQVRFVVGSYDHSKPLIIDPVLSYSSYLGGGLADYIGFNSYVTAGNTTQGVAADKEGSLYVTGFTYSDNFPLQDPYEKAPAIVTSSGGRYPTSFVTKFSPDGSSLVYSTYLGGSAQSYGAAIAVDSNGEAYVTGYTNAPDFPVTSGAYQTICGANWTVNKGVFTRTTNCGEDSNENAYVTKLNAAGTGLVYSTFLGGQNYSLGMAIAVDEAGRAYVAGDLDTVCAVSYQPLFACFPTTTGAVITGTQPGGDSPPFIFVSVLGPAGAKLLYSTIFGDLNGIGNPTFCGSCTTYAAGIAVDANGNFYVTGDTLGAKLPTTKGVVQPTSGPLNGEGNGLAGYRGFVAKFKPVTSSGSSLAYATYLGGHDANYPDEPTGIAVDATGNAYIAGFTESPDFPVTPGAYQNVCAKEYGQCPNTAFVAKLNPEASAIDWATYFGDAPSAYGSQGNVYMMGPVQLDGSGNVYITGSAIEGMPEVNPLIQISLSTAEVFQMQAFVAKFDPAGSKLLFASYLGSGAENQYAAGLAVDAEGNMYAGGNTGGALVSTPGAFQTAYGGGVTDGFVMKIAPRGEAATKLYVTPSPATVGQPVTLTAIAVFPENSSVPTGTVTFKSGSRVLGTETLTSAGTASLTNSTIVLGTHSLIAEYSGDGTYPSDSSAIVKLIVNKGGTSTTLTATPNPAIVGQTVTFTAQVKAATGTAIPDGTMTFFDGATELVALTIGSAGKASFTTAKLSAGSHSITAVYAGNATFAASTSNAAVEKIAAKVATATTLSASALSVVTGTAITFTAKVVPASGSIEPTGMVTFLAGTNVIGKSALDKTGAATLATATLAKGQHSITASYAGDAGDGSSLSRALVVTITAQ